MKMKTLVFLVIIVMCGYIIATEVVDVIILAFIFIFA